MRLRTADTLFVEIYIDMQFGYSAYTGLSQRLDSIWRGWISKLENWRSCVVLLGSSNSHVMFKLHSQWLKEKTLQFYTRTGKCFFFLFRCSFKNYLAALGCTPVKLRSIAVGLSSFPRPVMLVAIQQKLFTVYLVLDRGRERWSITSQKLWVIYFAMT